MDPAPLTNRPVTSEDETRRGSDAPSRFGGEARPAPPILPDDRLLELLQDGDLRALDILVRRYGSRLVAYVRRITGDEASAEDVTHDVFVRIIERSFECRDSARLEVWIFRIARNLALDRLRRRAVRDKVSKVLSLGRRIVNPASSPSRQMERDEMRQDFERALASLPETFRSVFLLREVEGLSYEEIAQIVGVRAKTVSTRIFRARESLRDRMGHWLDLEDVR